MIRLPQRARRQRVAGFLLVLLGVASLAVFAWIGVSTSGTAGQITGVAGLAVSVAGLALTLVTFLQPPPETGEGELADILAETLRGQWDDEVTARRLRDPSVIPLTWSATGRPVADTSGAITGRSGARIRSRALDGRLQGGFDESIGRLADGYRQIPSGRLVVLGEPGAGKTVLAVMLVLGLLEGREGGAAVPALLSVSSWDPVSESLDDWIVQSLATAYYNGRPEVPRRLLNRRLLLPVLDGLDEMPESARRSAVRGINLACGDGRGVVVTCRSAEYQDVIEGGAPVLRRAPVVEIRPVSAPDARAYLSAVEWPEGTDWSAVHERLETQPDSPVSQALSTPLMLSLARTVHQHCPEAPAGLLEHDSRHEVEDHLVDRVILAAYAPRQAPGDPAFADPDWRVRAERAERRLTYLARYLHQHRERDLAWWLMSGRLLSRWAGPALGIGLGVLVMLTISAGGTLLVADADIAEILGAGAAVGGGFAVLAMFIWFAAPEQPPGRLSFAVRGSLGRLRRGYVTGLALTAIPAVPLIGAAAVTVSIGSGWSVHVLWNFSSLLMLLVAVASSIGLALAVHNWLDAPPERSTRAGPLDFLVQDRRSSLTAALCAGAVLSLSIFPLVVGALLVNLVVVALATGWSNEPLLAEADALLAADEAGGGLLVAGSVCGAGAVLALLVLLTRAWPRFVLTRLVLAAQRRLPWRLMGFLADARERQLLRQSGGTYQFRHVRLQERLASRSLAEDRLPPDPAVVVRRRRRRAGAVAVVLAVLFLVPSAVLPGDTSRATSVTGTATGMALSPDGSALVTGTGPELARWDTETGERIGHWYDTASQEPLAVGGVTETTDDRMVIAYRYSQRVSVRAIRVGAKTGRTKSLGLRRYDLVPHSCGGYNDYWSSVLSGDGTRLALAAVDCVLVWDLPTNALVARIRLDGRGSGMGFGLSQEGDRLMQYGEADAESHTLVIRWWDLGEDVQADVGSLLEEPRHVSIDLRDRPYPLALSGDGTRLAVAQGNEVHVWETGIPVGDGDGGRRGEIARFTGHIADVGDLALDEDGSTLAATADDTTRFWTVGP